MEPLTFLTAEQFAADIASWTAVGPIASVSDENGTFCLGLADAPSPSASPSAAPIACASVSGRPPPTARETTSRMRWSIAISPRSLPASSRTQSSA